MNREEQAWVIGAAMERAFSGTGRKWSARIDWSGCMLRVSASRGKRGVIKLLSPSDISRPLDTVCAVRRFAAMAEEPMVMR